MLDRPMALANFSRRMCASGGQTCVGFVRREFRTTGNPSEAGRRHGLIRAFTATAFSSTLDGDDGCGEALDGGCGDGNLSCGGGYEDTVSRVIYLPSLLKRC